jgi:hypothetical protein
MAEILSDALKENQCKSLMRLIASLTDGAVRPKSARILCLANMKGKLLQSDALIETSGGDYKQQSRASRSNKAPDLALQSAALGERRFLSPSVASFS